MKKPKKAGMLLAGAAAGAVNGLFGAGGGMVLVPLLTGLTELPDEEVFPASVSVILPICLISLSLTFQWDQLPWKTAIPYLIGSALGGIGAGLTAKKLSTLWLHRLLGILILWGGVRYLC